MKHLLPHKINHHLGFKYDNSVQWYKKLTIWAEMLGVVNGIIGIVSSVINIFLGIFGYRVDWSLSWAVYELKLLPPMILDRED